MNHNLYLTGFMGTGKSVVGQKLAKILKRNFVDLDKSIETRFKMPITKIFTSQGEKLFRTIEQIELIRLSKQSQLVIAVGGGAPESATNRYIMHTSGRILYLHTSLDVCKKRLNQKNKNSRPLWQKEKFLTKLYKHRQKKYTDYDLIISTDNLNPETVIEKLCIKLLPEKRFKTYLDQTICHITASWNSPAIVQKLQKNNQQIIILSEQHVINLHAKRYQTVLNTKKNKSSIIAITPGETSKNLLTIKKIYHILLKIFLEKHDFLIAFGGGMITDLGAFIASTYKRGVNFALVSTSLLSCVDAAIGGKAALNLGQLKNIIGLFTKPKVVILDLRALSTLPQTMIAEGLIEAYKTGLVASPNLAELIEKNISALKTGDLILITEVTIRSAQIKAQVVSLDFYENNSRLILNLGHTYGHTVETFHHYRISHGHSVAVGLMVATALSMGRKLISNNTAYQIFNTIKNLINTNFTWPTAKQTWEIMTNDKKKREGKILFILLVEAGWPLVVNNITLNELTQAILIAKEK